MSVQILCFSRFDPGAAFQYARFTDPFQIEGFSKTAGANTTVTAVETTGDGNHPFDVVNVGDLLYYQDGLGVGFYRTVTAKASSISLTVDSAWDLTATGKSLKCYRRLLGTTATDGWISTGDLSMKTVKINVTAVGSGSVTYSIEGRMAGPDTTPAVIATAAIAVVNSVAITINEPWDFVRVGLKETAGAGVDSVDVFLVGSDVVSTYR